MHEARDSAPERDVAQQGSRAGGEHAVHRVELGRLGEKGVEPALERPRAILRLSVTAERDEPHVSDEACVGVGHYFFCFIHSAARVSNSAGGTSSICVAM